jgi:uncharacterized protein
MDSEALIGPVELLIFQSTPFCNLDCKYCYLPDRLSKNKISFDIIEKTLLNLIEENLIDKQINILWHAGEPTVMSVDFYRKVTEILIKTIPSEVKIKQQIQTNGTLINDEWCKFFIEANIDVGISLDGPKHINDKNRVLRNGKGTFDDTIKGINFLKKYSIPFSVISVLTEYSLGFPDDIYSFFKKLNVISLGFNTDEVEGTNLTSSIEKNSIPKLKEFWGRIFDLQLDKGSFIDVREVTEFNRALFNSNFDLNPLTFGQMTKPLKILTIDTDGNYSTFSPELLGMKDKTYGNFIFGNVFENKFSSIFLNEKFIKVFDDIISGIRKCHRNCEYFSFCGGGAPSNKLYENGTFNSDKTDFCLFNKKILVDTFLEKIENELK